LLFYPPLIGKLLRQGKALIFVHFITLQLFWIVLIGFWLILVEHNALGIVVVGVALPPALMLHARAWGRLVWLALNCELPPAKRSRHKMLAREEEPLEVDLELVDNGSDVYAVQPVRAAVCERLITMTEIQEEHLDFERIRRERLGVPNPVDPPTAPTFDLALGPQAFRFLVDHSALRVWLNFGLMCLIEMTLLFFAVSTFA
jgi:hypothetical protein